MNALVNTSVAPLVLLGAGGHAKVLLALIRAAGLPVVGVCDPALAQEGVRMWRDLPVLGGDEALADLNAGSHVLVNGVGPMPGRELRWRLYEQQRDKGFAFPKLIHPYAWVDGSVVLEDGVQIMAGAILQPDCLVAANCTINTGARVDHDCRLDEHVHVAPGAVLCGGVRVGRGAFVGAGSTIIQGLSIGAGAVVGAGATCVRDVPAGAVVVGPGAQTRPHS